MDGQRMTLEKHLDASRVIHLNATTKDEALVELVESVSQADAVTDGDALLGAVRDREKLLSTGIGLGIAIPHARIGTVTDFVVAVGRRAAGIEFGSIDGKPVTIVVLIVGPKDAQKPYLELLAQLSKRLKLSDVRERVMSEASAQEVVDLLTAS